MASSSAADGPGHGGADLASAPEGIPLQLETLPADPVLRERLLALGLRPGEVVTVLRRGRPGGILHLAHGMTEFMLRRQQAAEIQVRPAVVPGPAMDPATDPAQEPAPAPAPSSKPPW